MIDRFRTWFDRRLQPQPDGTWLARPYGMLGGVYGLDAAMRERYLRIQSRMSAVGLVAAMAGAALVILFIGWFPYLLAALVVLANLHYFLLWRTLRTARKVPRERWSGSRARDPAGLLPRWLCRLFAWVSGILAALGLVAMSTEGANSTMVLGVTLLGGCSYFYWRLGRRAGERETARGG
jgi:hypothetical protein